jgi:hypothetical protein
METIGGTAPIQSTDHKCDTVDCALKEINDTLDQLRKNIYTTFNDLNTSFKNMTLLIF